jgi:hypothetical protein
MMIREIYYLVLGLVVILLISILHELRSIKVDDEYGF